MIVAALILVALYVVGPQPHVEWTEATDAQPAVFACVYATGLGFSEPVVGLRPRGTDCLNDAGAVVPGYRPKMTRSTIPARPARRRFALYSVNLPWRLFDVDLASGYWDGFSGKAVYVP